MEENNQQQVQPKLLDTVYQITAGMFQIYLGHACDDIMQMVSLYFMGQYTDAYQTAIFGVAWLIISLIAFPFCFGITQALNNQTSIAMGQNKLKLSQLYLNFTIWTIIFVFLPIFSLIIYYANDLLSIFIVSESQLSVQSARIIMIPLLCAALFFMEIESLKLYMTACEIFRPFPYIYFVALAFHFILCSILFDVSPSVQNITITILSSQALIFFIIIVYIYLNPQAYSLFKGFELGCKIFKHKQAYKLFMKVSFFLVFHQYADFILFYSMSLIAFSLGINQTSAQLAFANTYSVLYKFPLSLQIVLMLYIGNNLSQNKIELAKTYMKSGLGIYAIILTLKMSLLLIFQQYWANIYTQDPIIQDLIFPALPYFVLSFLLDSIQGNLAGVLKGVNKQQIPLQQTLIGYYIIGIPLILILTFSYNLGLIGIWLGSVVANIYLVIVQMIYIILLDWKIQVQEIQTKLNLPENCIDEHQYQLIDEE